MAQLQDSLRRLQSQMIQPDGPTGGRPDTQLALPPLMSDAGSHAGASRVHFLYFLTSFLLRER
eukprot:5379338-Prymnesium_polylepis.1